MTMQLEAPKRASSEVPATKTADLRRSQRRRRRRRNDRVGWFFIGVPTVIVLGLSIFPAAWAFFISRQKWNLLSPPKDVGWRNYQVMAADPGVADAVKHTLFFTALFVQPRSFWES